MVDFRTNRLSSFEVEDLKLQNLGAIRKTFAQEENRRGSSARAMNGVTNVFDDGTSHGATLRFDAPC
jgi:hypothetical protein